MSGSNSPRAAIMRQQQAQHHGHHQHQYEQQQQQQQSGAGDALHQLHIRFSMDAAMQEDEAVGNINRRSSTASNMPRLPHHPLHGVAGARPPQQPLSNTGNMSRASSQPLSPRALTQLELNTAGAVNSQEQMHDQPAQSYRQPQQQLPMQQHRQRLSELSKLTRLRLPPPSPRPGSIDINRAGSTGSVNTVGAVTGGPTAVTGGLDAAVAVINAVTDAAGAAVTGGTAPNRPSTSGSATPTSAELVDQILAEPGLPSLKLLLRNSQQRKMLMNKLSDALEERVTLALLELCQQEQQQAVAAVVSSGAPSPSTAAPQELQ